MKKFLKSLAEKQLWSAAQRVLANDQPFVIAVTGSVGKTTTKDAILHLLKATKKPVHGTFGNMNTELTVPLIICGQSKPPRTAWQWLVAITKAKLTKTAGFGKHYNLVLEFASEKKGDIAFLAERVPLDVAVFTRFVISHAGETLPEITTEKLSLIKGLKDSGLLIVNKDDEQQQTVIKDGRVLTYGQNKADLTFSKIEREGTGTVANFSYKRESHRIHTTLLGQHLLGALAAAMLVSLQRGLKMTELIPYAESFTGPAGRMRLIAGKKEITIIDDSYNSSPAAAVEAINTLAGMSQKGHRTVAILGNMNSLGKNTVSAHIELGQAVARAGIDYLVAVGPNAKRILRGAREGGMASQKFIGFATPQNLIARLDNLIQAKDIILVKASQDGMRFERASRLAASTC